MPKASQFLQAVLAHSAWTSELFLVDVGASGGVSSQWDVFGAKLRAVGFDPLIAAVEALNAREERSSVRYEAAFVGCRENDPSCSPQEGGIPLNPFARSSAVRAAELTRRDLTREVHNQGATIVYTERRLTLDDYFSSEERATVDFLKVDTDGSDLQVLIGSRELLRTSVLGLKIEVQFQGHAHAHAHANTFANIDSFLRELGFSLFDLRTFNYSRAALPALFTSRLMASTVSGQLLSGHAVYFRDIAHLDYERHYPFLVTPERILKLAALYDVFGLPDCAAELLINRQNDLPLLDLLPRSAGYTDATYTELNQRFDQDPAQFISPTIEAAERIKELKAKNRALKERLRKRAQRTKPAT